MEQAVLFFRLKDSFVDLKKVNDTIDLLCGSHFSPTQITFLPCEDRKEFYDVFTALSETTDNILVFENENNDFELSEIVQGYDRLNYVYEKGKKSVLFVADNQKANSVVEDLWIPHLQKKYDTSYGKVTFKVFGLKRKEILAATDGKASTAEICEAFVKTPLLFNPGERFYYGLSFDVLGVVIEKVTGTHLDEYVKKTIFEHLGMFDSGFTRGDGEAENLKALYAKTADGITVKVKNANELVFSPYYLSGGAGVVSTTEDYMKFADCLTNGGKAANGYRLLKESSVKDMAKNHVGEISVNNGFTCVQGDDYAYGYGVRTRIKPLNFGLPVGEFGWDGAAGSYFMCDLENRVTVYIGMCLMNWPATFKREHLKIVKTIYDSLEI